MNPSLLLKDTKEKELKDEENTSIKTNIVNKFLFAMSVMTIEPMMVLQGIASNIVMVPEDQMVLYKICRGISLGIHRSMQLRTLHFCRGTV